MMSIKFLVFILLAVFLVGGLFWLGTKKAKISPPVIPDQQTLVDQPTNVQDTPASEVPLPTDEDVIRLFFNLINENQIPEAMAMMSPDLVPDDSSKQAWGVHFNAIESIKVQQIEPYNQEAWSEDKHEYRVSLEVAVSETAADAPIPYYGWGDSPEFRWITIKKDSSGSWQIAAIATGP